VVHCESPIVTAQFERDASELAAGLKDRRILVAARRGNLRVSPHFYNSEEDIDRLAHGLREVL
jgi:selenocysteine lyase/cysteine desulfurase